MASICVASTPSPASTLSRRPGNLSTTTRSGSESAVTTMSLVRPIVSASSSTSGARLIRGGIPKLDRRSFGGGQTLARANLQGLDRSSFLQGASSSIVGGESRTLWRQIELGKNGVKKDARGGAMGSTCMYGMANDTVRWALAAATTVLILKSNPGVRKQLLVPILALEAPAEVVHWIKSEYGLWLAFVGLALRLFYSIPGELDFPLGVYLFISAAPIQALSLRGTMGGVVASTVFALICAYQYFTYISGVQYAFKSENLLNTVAISVMTIACIGFFGMRAM